MKQVSKTIRAKVIKDLTNNGRNRHMIYSIQSIMSDKVTLELFNAL